MDHLWSLYFFGLCILIFGIAPSILSSNSGKRYIEKRLSKKTGGEFRIEKLYLAWFGPQTLKGIEFHDSSNHSSISIEKIHITASLWNLLITKDPSGTTTVTSPYCNFDASYYVKEKKNRKLPPILIGLTRNLIIENADIIIEDKTFHNIELHKTNIKYRSKDHDQIELAVNGTSKMIAHAGQFDIKTQFSMKEVTDKIEKSDSLNSFLNNADFHLKSKTINFPIVGLDHLISVKKPKLNGFLVSIFGPMLNSDIDIDLDSNNYKASIDLLSNHIKLSFHTQSASGGISLVKSSFFSFNLNPTFYNKLTSILDISRQLDLTQDGYFQLSLDRLFIPKVGKGYNFEKSAISGKLASSALMFKVNKIDDFFNFNTFNLNVNSTDLSELIEVSGQSSVNYKAKNPALVSFSFNLEKLFTKAKLLTKSLISNAKLDVSHFPLLFVDKLLDLEGKLVENLGENISLKTTSKSFPQKNQFTSTILTPKLHVPNIILSVDESVYLEKPAGFIYLPNENTILPKLTTEHFKLNSIGNIKGHIEAFGISLDNLSKRRFERVEMQVQLALGNILVEKSLGLGSFDLINTRASINVDTAQKISFETTSSLSYPQNSTGKELLGKNLDVIIEGVVSIKSLNNIFVPKLKGHLKSDKLNANFLASIEDHFKTLAFLKPVEISLLPSPELVNKTFARDNKLITYVPYIPIEMSFSSEPIALGKDLFTNLNFTSTVALKRFDIVNKTWYREFSFDDTIMELKGNSKKKTFSADLRTHAQTEKTSAGILHCSFKSDEFSSLDFYKNHIYGKIDFQDFSSSLVDAMLGFHDELSYFFGNSFDLKVNYEKGKDESLAKIDFDSSKLTLDADLSMTDKLTLRKSPMKISWQINNDTLLSIQNVFERKQESSEQFVKLSAPTILHGKVTDLHWPLHVHKHGLLYDKDFDVIMKKILQHIRLSTFDIDLTLGSTDLESISDKRKTRLNDFNMNLVKDSTRSPFIFNLKSQVEEFNGRSSKKNGSISAAGTLEIPTDIKEPTKAEMQANMHNFPTLILDSFVKTFGISYFMPSIFLGESVNASLDTKLADLSGTFDFYVNSDETKLNFNAYLNDGILKLYKPIRASLKVTKELADHLLKNMNITLVDAKSPLELYISDKGFYMPLKPFKLENLQIRDGSLDLKRIVCSNIGSPNDVGGIFKLKTSKSKDLSLWFAPSEFSLSNGLLNIDRTEILF